MVVWRIVLLIIAVTSSLLPLTIGIRNRKNLLWIYILTSFVFDILMITIKRGFHINVAPLGNLYFLVEFILLSTYYYKHVDRRNRFFIPLIFLLAAAYIVEVLMEGITQRNGVGTAYFYAAYIFYALFGFYTMSRRHEHDIITSSSFFWVNVAILVGSSARFILFLFEDYLVVNHKIYLGMLWAIYQILSILMNTLFAIALTRKYE